jgi:hypothetical protein
VLAAPELCLAGITTRALFDLDRMAFLESAHGTC